MSDTARQNILAKVRSAAANAPMTPRTVDPWRMPETSQSDRIALLKKNMEAVRTEVWVENSENWTDRLKEILRLRKLQTFVYAPETVLGRALETAWASDAENLPALTVFQGEVEEYKDSLFEADAAITTTRGAVAETGALILWPDRDEPRLMSLVPPIHIAVLEAGRIYGTFSEAMTAGKWPEGMPTNALLISGPSKTADIELTLAFGVHGPKELIVFILE